MVDKPTKLPRWAENNVEDPISGQNNVLEPPEEKKDSGWARLEFPPRQWFNWLSRKTWEWLAWLKQQEEQAVVTDGDGVGLFPTDGALITLYAVDTSNNNVMYAIGHKQSSTNPTLEIIYSTGSTLGLGTATPTGNQAISGGTAGDIIVWGQSKIIP